MTTQELPTLLTSRLRLRTVAEDDVAHVRDMYSRPEVTEFIGTADWVETTREQALSRIARYRAAAGTATGIWLIETLEQHRPAGFALLKPIPWSRHLTAPDDGTAPEPPQDLEIGWHLHPDTWGQGYATESARALLAHARRHRLDHLVAVTHRENLASQRVATRIGMTHRGITDRYYDTTCELFTIEL
ncbi:GNAT family N-acetyltransferase [Nesterenkonia sp. HG001]|uniref:GNAT family N-acetyltransferase n=1 Tax=Nesterenkonia sp. HG001 TaxID=2983207 RepID=UPI002AC5BC3F|nr:GNAT family N-acetyltransferase [Nesterenkonia sp. HG001]MDZ5078223.1 GNAT family N-acetyltransferase [Nesterenkonia sp. HG001]